MRLNKPRHNTMMFLSNSICQPSVITLLLTSFFGVLMTPARSSEPEVMLNNKETRLVGRMDNFGELQVKSFLGIRYAVPPTGELRFQKTVPLTRLPEVVNATQYGAACVSVSPKESQSEDCLFLNVWAPVTDGLPQSSPQAKAVIVWVHGGGFVVGDSSETYGGWLAAENDVIVVSMNYRLGPIGFLSTGDSASVGNYGLWDQHTALLWVQRNIAAFGGDPGAVTLMGESAGGKSVSFQVVSPHSSGLFHRAIMQSGTVYSPTALQWKPVETALRLGRAVGCDHSAHDELVDCLRKNSAHQIANASNSLWVHDVVRTLIDFGWAPVEDGDFVPLLFAKNGTLLPLTSSAAFKGAVMIGINNNEGSMFKQWRIPVAKYTGHPNIEAKLVTLDFFKNVFLPGVLQQMFKSLPSDTAAFSTAAEVITYKYMNWSSGLTTLDKPDLYSVSGDESYVSTAFQFVRQWLTTGMIGRDQVYVYVFDNYPEVPAEEGLAGMKHADDVPYTFGSVQKKLQRLNASVAAIAKETKLGKDFRKLLTNFAKSGNPGTPSNLSEWPSWPLYNLHKQAYLAISSTPRIATRFRAAKVILWTDLVSAIVTRQPVTCPESGTSAARSCLPDSLALTCWIALFLLLFTFS